MIGAGGNAGASGTASGGSAGAVGNSLAEACIAYAVALCQRRAECYGRPVDERACLTSSWSCPDVVTSSGSTRTLATLQACAAAYRTFSCDDFAAGKFPDCVTPGTLPRGAPCQYPSQCSTLSCKVPSGGACGVCALAVDAGESCSAPDVNCRSETFCDAGTCRTTEAVAAQAGKPCTGLCVTDYYCEPNSKICTALPTAGESCATLSCATGTYCTPDTHLCQPLPGKDEPCSAGSLCGHDLTCDTSKAPPVCAPLLGPGADCTGLGQPVCRSDLSCLCPPGTPTKMSCAKSSCYSVRVGGQACDDPTSQCHPAFTCSAGKCVPKDSQGLLAMDCMP